MNHAAPASVGTTPKHLWFVGAFALLWNSLGALDFVMAQTRNAAYMAGFSPEQLAYFDAFPTWVVATWAVAVWGSLLGSFLLLLRNRWAVPVFGVALASLAITTIYNFGLANAASIMGIGAAVFSVVIVAIAIALFVYARRLARAGVLR